MPPDGIKLTNIRWEKYVKKYVWNDKQTPFFLPVGKLTREQANKELSFFAIFLATPFALIGFAAVGLVEKNAALYLPVAGYALSILIAAILTRFRPRPSTVIYSATAPLAILLAFVVNGFPEKLGPIDQAVILIADLCWLRYTYRILALVRALPRAIKRQPTDSIGS